MMLQLHTSGIPEVTFASQESSCTSEEQATFIKASQALMWVRTLCWFYTVAVQTEINCGNKSLLM